MTNFRDILRQYWHYDDFRPLQAEIIESVAAGRDTLALMPTGGGKSLCFQVPTMAMTDPCDPTMEGLCLVITPLIALMKDQVAHLRDLGIRAYAIYSGMNRQEIITILDNCQFGGYKFLYVSPERLESAFFRKRLTDLPVCMIAVDEAHCISQWGYDFRPPYLRIAAIRNVLQERLRRYRQDARIPVLALTATATPSVVTDIQDKLEFQEPNVFRKSFRRENLTYVVRSAAGTTDKLEQSLHILNKVPGSCIIYVRSRAKTKEVAEWLVANGIPAEHYHAGLDNAEKDRWQQAWQAGSTRVMVATNAFGMGIDKPDVRTVIHLDLPDSIEAYFQEAGRAGRDGKRAYAILLYAEDDHAKMLQRVHNQFPERDFILRVYDILGNWLQVGLGSGLDHTFPFPFEQFCADNRLALLPTYSALQILTQAGYITYIDEHETQPRVPILPTREELYEAHLPQTGERLLNALMRQYPGIFTEPAYIYEERLGGDLGMDKQQLNHQLILLAQQGLVKYIPRRKTPYIYYAQERLQLEYVRITTACYEDRLARYQQQIQAMLDYATLPSEAKPEDFLLQYFGETADVGEQK